MRSRLLSILATIIATASLGWLGWAAWSDPRSETNLLRTTTLWTAGAELPVNGEAGRGFASPGVGPLSKGISRIPDAAFLRRTHPELRNVSIQGDGVDSADTAALGGLSITWSPPPRGKKAAEISLLSWSEHLNVGQTFLLHGVVDFLSADTSLPLILESPDGTSQTLELKGRAGTRVPFTISAAAAVAPGRFEWKLRVGAAKEPVFLNALVVAPLLPKVLLLQASPNVEAGRLQRWLLTSGAEVSSRTLISTDRLRASSNVPNSGDVSTLTPQLLAKYDVVVTSDAGLLELKPSETAALENAIRRGRLGLLVVGESIRPGPIDALSPWHGIGLEKFENRADTILVRMRLASGVELPEPAALLSGTLTAMPLSFALVRDPTGQPLVAAVKRGLGTIARSRIVDTWHWLQDGQTSTYATYWSALLTTLARPAVSAKGNWRIADAKEGPLFVDQPVHFLWNRDKGPSPSTAQVIGEGSVPVTLPMQKSATDNATSYSTFWPVNPGWHEVRAGNDEAPFPFYVQPKNALPGVRTEERRRITGLLVEDSKSRSDSKPVEPLNDAHWRRVDRFAFALFVISASYLWVRQRRSRPS